MVSYNYVFYFKFSQRYELCSAIHISGTYICFGYIYYSTHFHFRYISMHVWVIPFAPLSYAEVFLSLALVVHIVICVRANTERRFSKICILRLCLHVYHVNVSSASVWSLFKLLGVGHAERQNRVVFYLVIKNKSNSVQLFLNCMEQ